MAVGAAVVEAQGELVVVAEDKKLLVVVALVVLENQKKMHLMVLGQQVH